jgi:hypothetical protein
MHVPPENVLVPYSPLLSALFEPIPLRSGPQGQSLRSTLNRLAIQPRRKAQKPSSSCLARRGPPAMNRACFSSLTGMRLASLTWPLGRSVSQQQIQRSSAKLE